MRGSSGPAEVSSLPGLGAGEPMHVGPWVTKFRDDPHVKGNVQHIGLLLASHANAGDPERPVWPSVKGLVAESGRAPATVRGALNQLRSMGYIAQVDAVSYRSKYPTPLDPQRSVWLLTYSEDARGEHLRVRGVPLPAVGGSPPDLSAPA